jgi:hypothetical protein
MSGNGVVARTHSYIHVPFEAHDVCGFVNVNAARCMATSGVSLRVLLSTLLCPRILPAVRSQPGCFVILGSLVSSPASMQHAAFERPRVRVSVKKNARPRTRQRANANVCV